jgi:hypothetical protein
MTVAEIHTHEERFYKFWEKLIEGMPDDVLESTMLMIKNCNELNELIKQEHGYRNADMEL